MRFTLYAEIFVCIAERRGKMSEEAPAAAEPPPPEEAGEAKPFSNPCMDLSDFVVKVDFFEGMHMMAEEVEKVEGGHNFRQVTGFPVFGVGQPSPDGMKNVLDKVKASGDEKTNRIMWFNYRKEPVAYINGQPCAPRDPSDLHHNISIQHSVDDMDNLER